jgi:hypothetical protein
VPYLRPAPDAADTNDDDGVITWRLPEVEEEADDISTMQPQSSRNKTQQQPRGSGVVGSDGGGLIDWRRSQWLQLAYWVSKNGLFEPYIYIYTHILPRQARNKHRENTQKRTVYVSSSGPE